MRRVAMALLAGCAAVVQAQPAPSRFEQDFDGEEKPWREIEAQLPAYPRPETLIPFQVSSAISNRYFVDAASVSVGSDGVVRYSLVVKSEAGAETVSFEGMRCDTRERKLYAFGRRDGSWARNRNARWLPIDSHARQARHHMVLFGDFFCPADNIVRTAEEAIGALKAGMHHKVEERYRSGGGD